MPLQSTSGAASYDAFGGGVPLEPVYIEQIFSTYVYAGNSSTQTITNGIDLAGKGGLVWRQGRSAGTGGFLLDTARGIASYLLSYSTGAASTGTNWIDSFNSNGFTMNANSLNGGATYVSWTFRKQPKFFDVVTYTGNGSNRTIAHDLGSVPGCIIVKVTNTADDWQVYHRANTNAPETDYLVLNTTNATADDNTRWNDTLPTSTTFSLGTSSAVNGSGNTYVAYIFAHDAGGFGLTGLDNVISCGSFTTDGSGNASVNLGYEPQWVLIKSSSNAENWYLVDNMRGFPVSGDNKALLPNLSNAEGSFSQPNITNTGFAYIGGNASRTYIYIAIRRGPMKVPTSGTSVYNAEAFTGTGATKAITTLSAPDMAWIRAYKDFTNSNTIQVYDRLRGNGVRLRTGLTNADNTNAAFLQFNNQMLATVGNDGETNGSGALNVAWAFKRAPGFFDVVCYTGTGVTFTAVTHNLQAVPELLFIKRRSATADWTVCNASLGLVLNTTAANVGSSLGSITSTIFEVQDLATMGASGSTYVAYLFATLAGVSKVGSYTGNGSSQTINCGFTGGARFVLVKATSTTGNWIVADSARGIVAGNDPALYLNSTAAEVTGLDWIDADSTGFVVNETATIAANTSGVSYIFIAVA